MSAIIRVVIKFSDNTVVRAQGSTLEEVMAAVREQVADEHAVVVSVKVDRAYVARRVAES